MAGKSENLSVRPDHTHQAGPALEFDASSEENVLNKTFQECIWLDRDDKDPLPFSDLISYYAHMMVSRYSRP